MTDRSVEHQRLRIERQIAEMQARLAALSAALVEMRAEECGPHLQVVTPE